MDGLVKGRIVYYVFSEKAASEVIRRRTDGVSIAKRMKEEPPRWPAGAQAHIGNPVREGDICPAMVVAAGGGEPPVNLKVVLDGSDTYWATSVGYDENKAPGTFHWMFDGQNKRYTPDRTA